MKLVYDYEILEPEKTIERFRKDRVRIPGMVKGDGVKPDKNGRIIVPIGTLVDETGKVCPIKGGSITGTPVGITANTKDVTDGPENVALYIRGHLQGRMLNYEDKEYSDAIGKAIMEKLPEIHIYPVPKA